MSCPEQYIPAFEKANRIRLQRAGTKKDILAGRLSFAEALSLECWRNATACSLLMALPRIGDSKAMSILSRAEVGQARLVRDLTERQARALVAALPDRLAA